MKREEHTQLMNEIYGKNKEEINEIFGSGMFNEIVFGAIVITMENLNYPKGEIEDVLNECQDATFDQYAAKECREAYKKLNLN